MQNTNAIAFVKATNVEVESSTARGILPWKTLRLAFREKMT